MANKKGSAVRGSQHPRAVLDEKKVAYIKLRARRRGKTPQPGKKYDLKQTELAKKYCVSTRTISVILAGKMWAHVKAAA